ncbi:MAG: LysR substrate-binding domain-containing protein [Akkermansiaceae bacterium]|nr:LysR substrate-binding domain-containing protein [Akkermansiaceae bacterium]
MITDFRLKVFETVARRLNFTRAAEELFITQPAVTRHVKELERLLDTRLFKREGRGIVLTGEGSRLLVHSRRILKEYEALNEDMASAGNAPVSGELGLGASSTMAQYVLPPLLALFNRRYPDIRIRLKSGNTEEIEQAVQDETVQLGIVEGTATRKDLHYLPFMADEIILAGGTQAAPAPRDGLTTTQLSGIPLIMRESGSGTRRIVEEALKAQGISPSGLHVLMTLGNTESIKLYLEHSPACAFLSSLAVREELKNGNLKRIPLRHMEIRRSFHFVTGHGDHSRINELFIGFCKNYYNKI